jgi:thioredoxin reductase (NADPH)
MTTTEVENFPGFPDGVTGPQLMQRMQAQAQRWGAELVTEDVIQVDLTQQPFRVQSTSHDVQSHSLIIATGATAKRLGLPSEEQYWNHGISACAICDGAVPLFRNVPLVIIGAGDTAAEEALYLTKYGSEVHMLVRSGQMRASKAMQDRVLDHPKITLHWHTEAIDVYGEAGKMTGVKVRNNQTGEAFSISAKGLFYAIGHTPNTQLFQGQLELDPVGYIVTRPNSVATSIDGVYAAGDVQDYEYRQAITAAGTGCMAALLAERWLSHQGLAQEFKSHPEVATVETTLPAESQPPETPTATTAVNFDPHATRFVGGYALRKLYHESDRLIMVKYASPTCGPCHTLKPILSQVVDEFDGRIHYVEIDLTEDPEIAEAAGVIGTPTVQFFKHKDKVGELMGVKQKSQYREMIAAHV